MQKFIKTILDPLLFSNLFIGLCAAAQVAFTYEVLSLPPDPKVLALVFFATLALYNFSMLLSKPKAPQQSPYRRVRWIFSHQRWFISLSIIAILATGALALLLSFTAQILLLFLAVIAVAYNLPLLQLDGQSIGLRNIPGLKIFIIAGVWAGSTVLLPLLEGERQTGISIGLDNTLLIFLQRFLLVMALTIPFDIRDLYQDKSHALLTLPVRLGEQKAQQLCFLLLAAATGLGWAVFYLPGWIAMSLNCLIAAWLIFGYRWEKNEYYYFLWLDGALLLPWLILQLTEGLF